MGYVTSERLSIENKSNALAEAQPELDAALLDAALRATIGALAGMDADRLDVLVRGCEVSLAGVQQETALHARDVHRILVCLLAQTPRNLQLLARIAEPGTDEYSPPVCSQP